MKEQYDFVSYSSEKNEAVFQSNQSSKKYIIKFVKEEDPHVLEKFMDLFVANEARKIVEKAKNF